MEEGAFFAVLSKGRSGQQVGEEDSPAASKTPCQKLWIMPELK